MIINNDFLLAESCDVIEKFGLPRPLYQILKLYLKLYGVGAGAGVGVGTKLFFIYIYWGSNY